MPLPKDKVTIRFTDESGNPTTFLAEGIFRGKVSDENAPTTPLASRNQRVYSGWVESAVGGLNFLRGTFELDSRTWQIIQSSLTKTVTQVTHYRLVYAELKG